MDACSYLEMVSRTLCTAANASSTCWRLAASLRCGSVRTADPCGHPPVPPIASKLGGLNSIPHEHLQIAALGGGISKSNVTTEMGVDLKVTNVASGHIVIADSVSSSVQQRGGFSIGGIRKAQSQGDPFADVQQAVAAKIAEAIVTSRIPIKVIQVQGDGTLMLNYGDVFFEPVTAWQRSR